MLRRSLLTAGLTLAAGASARAAPPSATGRTRFVALYTPGPAFDHSKSLGDQSGIRAHPQHLQGLLAQGRLVMGGPFLDDSNTGMSILDAASLEEARSLVEADPTVNAGLLRVEVKPWLAVFSRQAACPTGSGK